MSISSENKKILEEKRRKEIMTAAKKLFYINGFTATSMAEIAMEAHISKGLIYHYFKSKKDLLMSFSDEVDEYLLALKKINDPYVSLQKFGIDFLVNDKDQFASAPPIQILLMTFANQEFDIHGFEEHNPILKDFGRNYLGDFFRQGIEQGIFSNGNAQEFGDIYWSFLMGKLLPIKKGHESQRPEEYIDEILNIFRRD